MTLPITTILPFNSEQIKSGGDDLDAYLQELIFNLQRQYEDVAQAVNGDIRNDVQQGSRQYIPTVRGSTAEGAGTYTSQVGWVLRKGLIVDFWYDVVWTGHTGTGTLQLDLPYQAAETNTNLFTGTAILETLVFAGIPYGIVTNNGRTMQIEGSQSATTPANVAIATAGTLRGYVRYVGQAIERG